MRVSLIVFCMSLAGCMATTANAPLEDNTANVAADASTVQSFAKEFQKAAPLICRKEVCISELTLETMVDGQPSELRIRLERNNAQLESSSLSFHFFSPSIGWLMMTDMGLNGSVDVFLTLVADTSAEKITYTLSSCFDQTGKHICGTVEDRFTGTAKDGFYGHAVSNFLKALKNVNKKLTST